MQVDTVYLAPRGFTNVLITELQRAGCHIVFQRDRLVGVQGAFYEAVWAENTWLSPQFIPVQSIGDAARVLKSIQRNWALFSTCEHRRAALIQDALPKVAAKPHVFGTPVPSAPLGSWTLWSRDCVLASARCSSPFMHGEVHFLEDKETPPNRAYLKLWEVFTRVNVFPQQGDLCLDLGSSPGGWSWVLASLGARVLSVDKAPLAPHIRVHPNIEYCHGSAFALEPRFVGKATWLLSDVACYPDRLLGLVQRFLEEYPAMRMVCTIKLVGETDFDAIDAFLAIPESRCIHLFANKHEVTWVHLPASAG